MSQDSPTLESSEDAPENGATPVTSRQILVAEDDEELARLLADWLTAQFGETVDVHVATSIEAGIDLIESLPRLDLVLLDRRFPEGTGDELLETLTRRFDAIVVMITAVPPDEGVIRLPITDYLIKPIDRDTLSKRLSLLEKLKAAGVLDAYADARKASLLEFHLDDPDAHPLFRRFAARWSYDRIEVADDGAATYVYELYVSDRPSETERGAVISARVVGTTADGLGELVEAGELSPVGELVPGRSRYAWVSVDREDVVDPPRDGYVIYEFTGAMPEEFLDPEVPEDGRRLERILEAAYR